MRLKEALLAALKGDPDLVPKVTESLRKKIDEDSGAMARVVRAAGALEPLIEESARRNPSRLNRLGLKSAHLLAGLAEEDTEAGRRLSAIARNSIVGIVFVDVAGFTRFTAERGDGAAIELLNALEPIIHSASALGKGEVVKSLGDGFLLAFPSASQAVRAGVELRDRALSAREAGQVALPVRVSVHAGEPLVEGDDLLGHDVNLAARFLDHCEPDEVVVSDAAKALAQGRLRSMRFSGPRRVKIRGLTTPLEVWSAAPLRKNAKRVSDDRKTQRSKSS